MEFLKDMFRQVTGQSVRKGQFSISWRANIQRNELGIDTGMIADVFKTGRKVDSLVNIMVAIPYLLATNGMRIKTNM